jgi:hypothetical protein
MLNVVVPEIGHHLLKLALAGDGADQLLSGEIVGNFCGDKIPFSWMIACTCWRAAGCVCL